MVRNASSSSPMTSLIPSSSSNCSKWSSYSNATDCWVLRTGWLAPSWFMAKGHENPNLLLYEGFTVVEIHSNQRFIRNEICNCNTYNLCNIQMLDKFGSYQ